MKIANIVQNDLVNGPGIRTSIFVSGCPHHCDGCHNQELWDSSIGTEFSQKTIDQLERLLKYKDIKRGLSILGGEPLAPENRDGVLELCKALKQRIPDLNIWLWTGYVMNDLNQKNFYDILNIVDVVVDGPFVMKLKPGYHLWRGSSNQRVLRIEKGKIKELKEI